MRAKWKSQPAKIGKVKATAPIIGKNEWEPVKCPHDGFLCLGLEHDIGLPPLVTSRACKDTCKRLQEELDKR